MEDIQQLDIKHNIIDVLNLNFFVSGGFCRQKGGYQATGKDIPGNCYLWHSFHQVVKSPDPNMLRPDTSID